MDLLHRAFLAPIRVAFLRASLHRPLFAHLASLHSNMEHHPHPPYPPASKHYALVLPRSPTPPRMRIYIHTRVCAQRTAIFTALLHVPS